MKANVAFKNLLSMNTTTTTTAANLKVGSIFFHRGELQRVTYKRKSRRYAGFLAVQFVKHTPDSDGTHLYTSEDNFKPTDVVQVAVAP